MIDEHLHPEHWGIRPVLFSIGDLEISSYSFFVFLGLVAGLLTYFILIRKMGMKGEKTFHIVLAGVLGGILGSKLFYWIFNFKAIIDQLPDLQLIFSGRTITGGLLGGTLSVLFIKYKLGIRDKKGNIFAPAIALGVAIGRLGCFFTGCCYGTETSLFTGVDFGDQILRHPTQLYEFVFFAGYFVYALLKLKTARPGILFFRLMNIYFIFRFFQEFIRYNEHLYLGLSFFQYISIVVLIFINGKYLYEKRILSVT